MLRRYHKIRIMLVFLSLLMGMGIVSAREVLNYTDCVVEADDVIETTLFIACENLRISGDVRGDVVGAAVRAEIDGTVDGNIYLLAGQLDIYGNLHKDLHFGGGLLNLNPPRDDREAPQTQVIDGSLKTLALSAVAHDRTRITGEVIAVGYQLLLHGDVQREINFWGSSLLIDGAMSGNINAGVGDPAAESSQLETLLIPFNLDIQLLNPGLVITENGIVTGEIQYRGPQPAEINGRVDDAIIYYPPLEIVIPTLEEPGSLTVYASQFIREFTTLVALGGIALFFVPNLVRTPLNNLRARPFANFSVGMLAFILSFPVVLIGLVLSVLVLFTLQVIGLSGLVLAVGIVLALVNIGGVSLFYFMAIFIARMVVALAIGRLLLRLTLPRDLNLPRDMIALVAGVFMLALIVSLPVIGWLFNAATLFLGLGTILNVLLDQFRRIRDSAPTAVPDYAPSPVVTRPHRIRPDTPHYRIERIPVEASDDPSPTSDDDDHIIRPTIIPTKLDAPDTPKTADMLPPGMSDLPDGFDFSFFEDDEPEPDETA